MAIVDDIAAALTAAGYSNLRDRRFDTSTEDQIIIIPGGGRSIPIIGGSDVEIPKVQIQVRGAGTDGDALVTAEARAQAIKRLLNNNTNISNSLLMRWDGREPDYWTDDNSRHIFSIDFSVIRR